jgi:pyruvate formate lyase activating enzyme
MLFDIQRFSLHDGPGIRTTVFFKGCPLRCIWCHNPEGFVMDKQPRKDGVWGYQAAVTDVLDKVMLDTAYYRQSGGGLTCSGGEPLMQADFLYVLLLGAKNLGLHTCLETSGFASRHTLMRILPVTDLFIYDIKETSDELHLKYTGQSNILVLENLDYLYSETTEIILRCPLIPGINDSHAHLAGLARLSMRYPQITTMEIMPYHNMGRRKWAELGLPYLPEKLENTGKEKIQEWRLTLERFGCRSVTINE